MLMEFLASCAILLFLGIDVALWAIVHIIRDKFIHRITKREEAI